LRPFFAKDNYLMDAMAREESLLYAIPIAVLKRMFFRTKSLSFLLESRV
jgi:CBS domain-containing protein